LRYLGPAASTDRGATLNGAGATIEIAVDTVALTNSGSIVGLGALTKTGPGTLTLASGNSFSGGMVIRQGTVALGSQTANNAGGLSGLGVTNAPVTFEGGALEMFGFEGANNVNYNTLFNPLVVPEGQSGTLRMFQRGPTDNAGLASPLSGGGTLDLVVSYLRGSLDGDWSAFTGQINVSVKEGVANAHCRINNPAGYARASIFLNDGVNLYRNGGANTTTDIGELAGTAGAVLGWGTVAQNQAAANPTWRVGAKNTSATFAGPITNDGITSIIKVGSGTWMLTGASTHSGATTISNGVLALSGDGSIGGSTNIDIVAGAVLDVSGRTDATLTLNSGQMLSGDGHLRGSVVANAGSTVSPGAGNGAALGRLTITNTLLLQDGSVVRMNWNRASQTNDVIDGLTTITYGGELRIAGSFVGGETLKLFNAGSYQGFFTTITPEPPGSGLTWDDRDLYANGTLRISGSAMAPVIGTVSLVGNNLTLSGTGGPSGGTFHLLTATDVSLPLAQWLPIATNVFSGDGSFFITQEVDPAASHQYFVLQQAP
jgi:autotransporter-associated beta strand protein